MVKKKIIILIFIIFVISCTARREFSSDFHKGTEGLELEFLENAPPNELWYINDTPTEFLIGIGLRNKGTEDIRQGNIIISSELGKIKIEDSEGGIKRILPRIKGKGFEFVEGEFIPKYYNAKVIGAESGIPESLVEIKAKACYKYGTTASADICIDIPNPQYLKVKKSCESNKVSSYSGQGAPIVISKIREDIIPGENINQLQLEIYFENKGSGKIVNKDCKTTDILTLEEISFSDYSTKNEEMGKKKIRCELINDEIEIEENEENKIICYADLNKDLNPYLTILIIKLNYWYSTLIKKSVKIKNTAYEKEIEITEEKPIAFVPTIPKNEEEIKKIIKEKMNKNKPIGDFRNFRIPKEYFPDFGNPNIEDIKNIVNNHIIKTVNIQSSVEKIINCYMNVLRRESGYKQFIEEEDKLKLKASESGDKAGCCVGIAQINVNVHLKDEGKIGDANRAYEWITDPKNNIEKGVDIFLDNIKSADGDLGLAYGYYYGDKRRYSNVCSAKLDKDEKWWLPIA